MVFGKLPHDIINDIWRDSKQMNVIHVKNIYCHSNCIEHWSIKLRCIDFENKFWFLIDVLFRSYNNSLLTFDFKTVNIFKFFNISVIRLQLIILLLYHYLNKWKKLFVESSVILRRSNWFSLLKFINCWFLIPVTWQFIQNSFGVDLTKTLRVYTLCCLRLTTYKKCV